MRFATKVIHAGQEPDPQTGAVTTPLYLTSTYSQKAQDAYAYARGANPTRDALQKSLASLEDGKGALCFSSGMGAITTALTLLKKGDHAIVSDDCYGGVYRIFTRIMSGYGIESTFVDLRDLVDVEDAFRPETKIMWTESPTNPLMKVVDLRELAVIAKATMRSQSVTTRLRPRPCKIRLGSASISSSTARRSTSPGTPTSWAAPS